MGNFTEQGYIPTTFIQYLDIMYETLRSVNPLLFPDVNSKPDDSTIDAVKCRIDAEIFARLDQQLAANINNTNLNFAQGAALDALGLIQNSQRRLATSTVVTLTFTGIAGTEIPEGAKFRGDSFIFATNESATIVTGQTTVDATATCTESGANIPTEVNEIINGIGGLQSVKLKTVNQDGRDGQSDSSFRIQIKTAAYGSAQALAESVNGHIFQVPEVLDVRVYNNGLATADVVTAQPAHSLLTIVSLGTSGRAKADIVNDVWKAIFLVNSTGVLQFTAIPKLPPAQIHSNPKYPTPGYPQQTTPIAFIEPSGVPLKFAILIAKNDNFPTDWEDQVKDNIIKYSLGSLDLNASLEKKVLQIGVDIPVQEWTIPVQFTIIQWGGILLSLTINTLSDNIPINFYSVGVITKANIVITEK